MKNPDENDTGKLKVTQKDSNAPKQLALSKGYTGVTLTVPEIHMNQPNREEAKSRNRIVDENNKGNTRLGENEHDEKEKPSFPISPRETCGKREILSGSAIESHSSSTDARPTPSAYRSSMHEESISDSEDGAEHEEEVWILRSELKKSQTKTFSLCALLFHHFLHIILLLYPLRF